MKHIAILLLATLVLAGCGGGNSSDRVGRPAQPKWVPLPDSIVKGYADIEGRYAGLSEKRIWTTVATGHAIYMGYRFKDQSDGPLAGFLVARGLPQNGKFTHFDGNDFDFLKTQRSNFSLVGHYIPGRSMSHTLAYKDGGRIQIEQTYNTTADQPPSFHALTGTYQGTMSLASRDSKFQMLSSNENVSLTFDGNGRLTGHSASCQLTGAATLNTGNRARGPLNFYDLVVEFAPGTHCRLSGTDLKMRGVIVPNGDSSKQIDLMVENPKYYAMMFSGTK